MTDYEKEVLREDNEIRYKASLLDKPFYSLPPNEKMKVLEQHKGRVCYDRLQINNYHTICDVDSDLKTIDLSPLTEETSTTHTSVHLSLFLKRFFFVDEE